MRYIICLVLFFVVNINVLAQQIKSPSINLVTEDNSDDIFVVFVDEISADFVVPYYIDNGEFRWCPGTLYLFDKTTDNLLFSGSVSGGSKGNKIHIDLTGLCNVQQELRCYLTFELDPAWVAQNQWVDDDPKKSQISVASKEIDLFVSPRKIKIDHSTYDDYYSTKTYDGGTDVKDGFRTNFKPDTYWSDDETKPGILDADKSDIYFDIKSAAYKNKNCAGEKNSVIEVEFQNTGLIGDKAGNYELEFENTDKKVEFPGTITQKPLDLNLTFEKSEYDGTTTLNNGNLTSTEISTGVLSETVNVSLKSASSATFFESNVHQNKIIQNILASDIELNNNNYSVHSVAATGKINAKKIKPNIKFQKVYDGGDVATNSLTDEFKDKKLTHSLCTGVLDGEEVGFSFTSATYSTAGKHENRVVTIEGLQLSNSNYALNGYTSSGKITPQQITISLDKTEFTYGTSVFGTDINPTVSATNPAIGGTFTASPKNSTTPYNIGDMLPVGEYTISYAPNDATNYEVTNNNSVGFEVKPKEINVTLSFEKIYDGDNVAYDKVHNKSFLKSETILTHNQYTGILENDQIEFTLDKANFSKADCHTDEVVTCENLKFLNGNYNVNPVVIGTIKQRPVNVELYFEKEYDGTKVATDKLKTKEIKDGDITLSSNVVDFQFTTATFESENASLTNTQNVTLDNAAGLTNANYVVNERSVTGKVLPKNIKIGLNEGSPFTYGSSKLGTDIIPTITDNVSGVFKFNDMTFPDNSMIPVGNYRIKFTPAQPTNYTVTNNESVSFEVKQREIESITLSYNPNKIYDATDVVLNFSCSEIKGLLDIDNDKITVSAKYNDKKADDDNTVIEFTISPSESVIQNYSCNGTKILNSNHEELKTLTDWGTANFTVNGTIDKMASVLIKVFIKDFVLSSSDNSFISLKK